MNKTQIEKNTSVFFSRLSYSFGNEDWITESRALKIKSGDRVLCITASGDRPLHLLLDDCKEIVSIDANNIQNHLLNLKMAAMKELDYEEYLAFLGATPSHNRKEVLPQVVASMSSESGQYWLQNKRSIAAGILYQGALEQWSKKISRVIRSLRGKKVKKLFELHNIEEQRKFVTKHWDQFFWRKAFDLALNPLFTRLVLKDPGLFDNVDSTITPGSYIYKRMNACLMSNLARESPLMSLFLKGKVEKDAFPPYLTNEGFDIIRKRVDRISTKTTDLISYLESAADNSFDVFSISDVASYIGQDDFNRLMYAIYRTAKPGARFSIREFLSRHKIPTELLPFFVRDSSLEKELEKEDRCFVYRFMVGHIEGK